MPTFAMCENLLPAFDDIGHDAAVLLLCRIRKRRRFEFHSLTIVCCSSLNSVFQNKCRVPKFNCFPIYTLGHLILDFPIKGFVTYDFRFPRTLQLISLLCSEQPNNKCTLCSISLSRFGVLSLALPLTHYEQSFFRLSRSGKYFFQ